MRRPDVYSPSGEFDAWHVPIHRVADWVRNHPERVHQASRERFAETWRDLWYLHLYVHGGDIDDEVAERRWAALSLRDLSAAPRSFPRLYAEAEWELLAEWCSHVPPVDGDGLYDQTGEEPILLYQFHGLPEERVLNLDDTGEGFTFATYALDLLSTGIRDAHEDAHILSRLVNEVRERDGLHALAIGEGNPILGRHGSGLLVELEDGETVSAR